MISLPFVFDQTKRPTHPRACQATAADAWQPERCGSFAFEEHLTCTEAEARRAPCDAATIPYVVVHLFWPCFLRCRFRRHNFCVLPRRVLQSWCCTRAGAKPWGDLLRHSRKCGAVPEDGRVHRAQLPRQRRQRQGWLPGLWARGWPRCAGRAPEVEVAQRALVRVRHAVSC